MASSIKNITIIGDGAMASVMARMLGEKELNVTMWGYDRAQLNQIRAARENVLFLPGYKLPPTLIFQPDEEEAMKNADVVINAVPCQYIRRVWEKIGRFLPKKAIVVSVAKGIENETLLRPTEIIKDVVGTNIKFAVLSGPNIADELAKKLPASAVIAAKTKKLATDLQKIFNTEYFRVYTNADIVGVELSGAMKNVIAIAAGIIDGMVVGNNAKATLLSRGLAEITRLGVCCGAKAETFAGLAGLGDLVTTCVAAKGRNRSFGERIGKGYGLEQAKSINKSVIEGLATSLSVKALADKYDVTMPISQAVYQVVHEGKDVKTAIYELMTRELKSE